MLKMKTVKGCTTIVYKGVNMHFIHSGAKGIREALEFVFIQKFMSLVDGKPIGAASDTLYPVKSLVPPTRKKVVRLFDLVAEEAAG